jgi:hypothetical protein
MTQEKYVRLISKLAHTTNEGLVEWEPTARTDVYQAAFPAYGVRIWRDELDSGETDIVLAIVNSEGVVIDEVRDTSFQPGDFGTRGAFTVMSELFRNAKRRALGAEEALDALLKNLDEIPPF